MLRLLAMAPILFGAFAFAQPPPQPQPESVVIEEIVGVGLALYSDNGAIVVNEVIPNSPAVASKLFHESDRILAVGQGEEPAQSLDGKSVGEAVGMMRGKKGSSVRITVLPKGGDEHDIYEVLLKRERLNTAWKLAGGGQESPPDAAAPPAAALELGFERLPGGEADKLSNYRGRIVVLEFWGTWSDPCQAAVAEIQGVAGKFKEFADKVAFITVSMDGGKEKPIARLKEKGWLQTMNGWAARDALTAFQIHAAPSIYVIGPDGRILAENPRMTPETLEDMIKPLLKN
jgi:thiol-disulfide isomerase/thioredoxin